MLLDIPLQFQSYLVVGICFGVLWLGWGISWLVAAAWASRAAKRPALRTEMAYRVLTIIGALLMFVQFREGARAQLFWLTPIWLCWVLLVVAAVGIAFTWWARIHLGTLWSGRITRKADHHIVDTGPYGIVRHPIYTGLITALVATVLAFPGLLNVAGVVILIVAFVSKARLEERFLSDELGAEAYAAYRRRVPMLVPFAPAAR
jgi:protein-S-isoprenylcysteine O-methyltransferase Ste14